MKIDSDGYTLCEFCESRHGTTYNKALSAWEELMVTSGKDPSNYEPPKAVLKLRRELLRIGGKGNAFGYAHRGCINSKLGVQ